MIGILTDLRPTAGPRKDIFREEISMFLADSLVLTSHDSGLWIAVYPRVREGMCAIPWISTLIPRRRSATWTVVRAGLGSEKNVE